MPSCSLARGVVEAAAERGDVVGAVDAVDPAAREHVHAGAEHRVGGAPQHEHLDARRAVGGVTHQHHRRCRLHRDEFGVERALADELDDEPVMLGRR